MSPIVSVVICTHNRAKELVDAIQSVLSQEVDEGSYELLVVDNASTDSTREVVCGYSVRASNLKYLSETALGLSHARNAGLAAAKGEYVAYLDDDAVADAGWLSQIPVAFAAGGQDIGCVAGRIAPIWGAPRPPWLHDNLLGVISVLDCSPIAIRLAEHQEPFGANVIYRRGVLAHVGGFSTRLGRKGASLLSNEEILLNRRLKKLGYATYFDPRISVHHHVPAERLTQRWFRRRAYWQGVSDAFLEDQLEPAPAFDVALRRLRKLASVIKRPREILSLMQGGHDPVVFLTAFQALTKLGYATASFHSSQ
jgi:glycosyltransferase involved in cell wall biosynthesis